MSIRRSLCAAVLLLAAGSAHAQFGVGSAFTYQGQLSVSGQLASGSYDLQFRLLDSFTGGAQVGPIIAFSSVGVVNGRFTKQLDFGAAAMNGSARWLEISVRPAGSGSFTTLSPLQMLTPAPYALGLSLPCSESGATANTLLNLVQTAPNNAGALAGTVLNGTGTAVYGQASGTGSIGVWGYHLGTAGYAGFFRNESVQNTSPALRVEAMGGSAGDFQVQASADSSPAVNAATAGTGHAGFFTNTNTANSTAALFAQTNGTGDGFASVATGTGRAGNFVILNTSSGTPAIEASTSGFGYAGKFNGPVQVTGNLDAGNVTTGYGGFSHRAAPIAFGSFGPYHASVTNTSGSGNNTVTYLGNDVYRINVTGGSNSANWVVLANVAYSNPENPGITYLVRAGVPNSSGQVNIYAPCDSNCGAFSPPAQINFVIYQP